jgi:hypothetical protein
MTSTFSALKAALDVPTVAARYGVEARHGNVRCPFHGADKHPSAHLYPGLFKCFTCGESLDVIGLAQRLNGLHSPLEAAKLLDMDFQLGLFTQDKRTRERAQAAARQRELETARYAQFVAWEQNIYIELCDYCRELRETIETAPFLSSEWLFTISHVGYFTYLADWLCYADAKQKLHFYQQHREEVAYIEQRQANHFGGAATA